MPETTGYPTYLGGNPALVAEVEAARMSCDMATITVQRTYTALLLAQSANTRASGNLDLHLDQIAAGSTGISDGTPLSVSRVETMFLMKKAKRAHDIAVTQLTGAHERLDRALVELMDYENATKTKE